MLLRFQKRSDDILSSVGSRFDLTRSTSSARSPHRAVHQTVSSTTISTSPSTESTTAWTVLRSIRTRHLTAFPWYHSWLCLSGIIYSFFIFFRFDTILIACFVSSFYYEVQTYMYLVLFTLTLLSYLNRMSLWLHALKNVNCMWLWFECNVNVFYTQHASSCVLLQTFPGNTDITTTVTNYLPCPVNALCVRVNPTMWNYYISMQFNVLGCPA